MNSNIIPIGYMVEIYSQYKDKIPEGWIIMDGREIKKKEYPELYEAMKDAGSKEIEGKIKVMLPLISTVGTVYIIKAKE